MTPPEPLPARYNYFALATDTDTQAVLHVSGSYSDPERAAEKAEKMLRHYTKTPDRKVRILVIGTTGAPLMPAIEYCRMFVRMNGQVWDSRKHEPLGYDGEMDHVDI